MSKSIKDSQIDYLIGKVNTGLDNKVTKVEGKDLSSNDFSDDMKEKLSNIADGAEVNQNAFTAIKFNEIGILADNKNDIMHITSGNNITFGVDEATDSIVISADISGSNVEIYTQNDEPLDASEGAIWIDMDEDMSSSPSGNITLDQTLAVEGMAADAKAVGDAIVRLSEEGSKHLTVDIDDVNESKPQSPIRVEDTYIYPLTTVDQVIMEDGNRLNVAIDSLNIISKTTAEDNGKFLRVVNGTPVWTHIQNAEEVKF